MMAGFSVRAVDFIAAERERRLLTEANARMMETVDLVLMPGNFHTAARLDDASGMTAYTADTAMTPFNMSGHPALSFCTGFDAEGLPTSAQLVGRWFDEATILRAAHAYERATPWRDRFPMLS
jgi:aspartyl-tRNA(Asn)/glutamyl-tRNA(Gln) amidotransferase subunit A